MVGHTLSDNAVLFKIIFAPSPAASPSSTGKPQTTARLAFNSARCPCSNYLKKANSWFPRLCPNRPTISSTSGSCQIQNPPPPANQATPHSLLKLVRVKRGRETQNSWAASAADACWPPVAGNTSWGCVCGALSRSCIYETLTSQFTGVAPSHRMWEVLAFAAQDSWTVRFFVSRLCFKYFVRSRPTHKTIAFRSCCVRFFYQCNNGTSDRCEYVNIWWHSCAIDVRFSSRNRFSLRLRHSCCEVRGNVYIANCPVSLPVWSRPCVLLQWLRLVCFLITVKRQFVATVCAIERRRAGNSSQCAWVGGWGEGSPASLFNTWFRERLVKTIHQHQGATSWYSR